MAQPALETIYSSFSHETAKGAAYAPCLRTNPSGLRDETSQAPFGGKTLPLDKATEALMKEAGSPPPKMWPGNKLVLINQGNIEKAKALQSGESGKALQSQNGVEGLNLSAAITTTDVTGNSRWCAMRFEMGHSRRFGRRNRISALAPITTAPSIGEVQRGASERIATCHF